MRATAVLGTMVAAAVCPACESVPLFAPTESTIRLVVADASIPNGGSTTVAATVTETGGAPVQDGTLVTFTTTVGAVQPPEAHTARGQASATLSAGNASGTANVVAYSGNAVSEVVQVLMGSAAAASLHLTAQPGALPPGGGTTMLTATVLDGGGNALPNVGVAFAATAGRLRDRAVTTDAAGEARTALTTTTAADVTASVGQTSRTTSIVIEPPTNIAITATPQRPVAGQAVSFDVALTNEARSIRSAAIDFGDGRVLELGAAGQATVTHSYEAPGPYTVTVRATDAAGYTAAASIAVQVDPPPSIQISIAASPTDPVAGETVEFTVEVSPPDNAPAVREAVVGFGDGSRVSLGALSGRRSIGHVYDSEGSYIVTLTVEDATGSRHTASTGVDVAPAPGIDVAISASPAAAVVEQPVTFTVGVTPAAGALSVRGVRLDFGDGSVRSLGAVSGSTSASHVYEEEGSYVVTATVEDAGERRYTSSVGVQVGPAPGIEVAVSASPTAAVVEQPVTFKVGVTPAAGAPSVRGVTLDFGDGSVRSLGAVSGSRSVTHVYEEEGSYVVTATVEDAGGRRYTSSVGVQVGPAPGIEVAVSASPTAAVVEQPVTFKVGVTPAAGAPSVRGVTLDFGDGSVRSLGAVSGSRSVTHVYEEEGSYVVTATVEDAGGRRYTSSVGVQVGPAPGIEVAVSASPAAAVVEQPVTFTVDVTPAPGAPSVREVRLDLGDGSVRSLGAVSGSRSVTHVYEEEGSYVVTATVEDAGGRRYTSSVGVQVGPAPGIEVAISASPAAPVENHPVTFTVDVSREAGAPSVSDVSVDFGDGSSQTLGARTGRTTVTHIYEEEGSYVVTATVEDAGGRRYTSSVGVQVGPAPGIEVAISASPAAPVENHPVTFTVDVSREAGAPSVSDVSVDFGDGSSQTLGARTGRTTVTHIYEEEGSYVVTATVEDAGGRRYTSSVGVQVGPAPGIEVAISASPAAPVKNRPVTFTVDVLREAGAPSVSDVSVDFGDGSNRSLGAQTGRTVVTHVYGNEGSYIVTVTALDVAGGRHTSSVGVPVSPAPGIAVTITASPAVPIEDQPVTFTVFVSPAAGAPSVREVSIDFGDTSSQSLGSQSGRTSVTHVYENPGSYVVTATVLDEDDRRHTASIGIRVAGA